MAIKIRFACRDGSKSIEDQRKTVVSKVVPVLGDRFFYSVDDMRELVVFEVDDRLLGYDAENLVDDPDVELISYVEPGWGSRMYYTRGSASDQGGWVGGDVEGQLDCALHNMASALRDCPEFRNHMVYNYFLAQMETCLEMLGCRVIEETFLEGNLPIAKPEIRRRPYLSDFEPHHFPLIDDLIELAFAVAGVGTVWSEERNKWVRITKPAERQALVEKCKAAASEKWHIGDYEGASKESVAAGLVKAACQSREVERVLWDLVRPKVTAWEDVFGDSDATKYMPPETVTASIGPDGEVVILDE